MEREPHRAVGDDQGFDGGLRVAEPGGVRVLDGLAGESFDGLSDGSPFRPEVEEADAGRDAPVDEDDGRGSLACFTSPRLGPRFAPPEALADFCAVRAS